MNVKKLVIVIPSYDPDNLLIELLGKLNNYFDDFNIVLVNDGSTKGKNYFEECKKINNVTLLNHEKNQGKGQALKTAYKYIKSTYEDCVIVTADSDGQHKPEDIKKVYDFFLEHQSSLILGSRKFDCNVPKKSTLGNNISRNLLRIVLNKFLYDTQTGLRAFGSDLLDFMISVNGRRYEYEMNVLNECIRAGININEIAIQTIYIENNKSTHFRPIKDFSKIVFTLLKYAIPFCVTFIINTILCAIINFDNYFFALGIFSTITMLMYLFLSITGLLYGNKYIFRNTKKLLKLFVYFLIWFNLFCSLSYVLNAMIYALILANTISLLISGILNYFWIKKDMLYE